MHTISNQRAQQTQRPCLQFQKGRILGTELCPDRQTAGAAVGDRLICHLSASARGGSGWIAGEGVEATPFPLHPCKHLNPPEVFLTKASLRLECLSTEPTSQPATFTLSFKIFPAQGQAQPSTCQAKPHCHQQHSKRCWGEFSRFPKNTRRCFQ